MILCSKATHKTLQNIYIVTRSMNVICEYNKHNLIFTSDYRFTAQHYTIINPNAWPKKKLHYNTSNRIPEIYLQTEE